MASVYTWRKSQCERSYSWRFSPWSQESREASAPQSGDDLGRQVREAERAFLLARWPPATSSAFGALVADDAVFFGGRGAQRGKAASARRLETVFEQPQAPFSWEPETVEVLSSGNSVGLSSGPVKDPDGKADRCVQLDLAPRGGGWPLARRLRQGMPGLRLPGRTVKKQWRKGRKGQEGREGQEGRKARAKAVVLRSETCS